MTTESGPNYDPFQGGGSHRSMVIECEVDDLGNMLRGSGTAPAPLHYFAASILF